MQGPETSGKNPIEETGANHSHTEKLERVKSRLNRDVSADDSFDSASVEWKATFHAIKDVLMVIDNRSTIIRANLATSRLFDKSLEEIIGQSCWQVVHGTGGPPKDCPLHKVLASGQHEEKEFYLPEKGIWIEVVVDPIIDDQGRVNCVVHTLRDISDRKRTEEELRQSEKRFRDIFENSLIGMYQTTPDGRILMANSVLVQMLGYNSFEELATRNLEQEGFEPDYPRSEFKRRIETDGRIIGLESAWCKCNGTTLFVRESAQAIRDKTGNTLYYQGTVEDITEHKHAELTIRQSEEFLNSVIENTPNPMWLSDEKGTVIRMNQALRELLKVKDEEIIGRYNVLKDQQLREQGLLALVEKVFTEGRSAHFEMEYDTSQETQVQLKEHVYKTLELTLSPLRNVEGVITNVICQHRDITERKRAEAELREYQEKLKAMASEILQTQERERQRLAVGLHDDICQKLVLTKLTLESSLRRVSDAQLARSLKNMAETIGQTIRQAESLTFELSDPVLRVFGFVAALEKYLATEIRSKHGIAYELEADEHLDSLRDEIKTCLFRVTRELLTNVVKHAQAQKVKVSVCKTQDEIHVTVQDDGVGFDPAKVKGADPGSVRFGLFSVREQLEYVEGLLIIESKPGRGTRATVVI